MLFLMATVQSDILMIDIHVPKLIKKMRLLLILFGESAVDLNPELCGHGEINIKE